MSFLTLEILLSWNAGFVLCIFWILVGVVNVAFLLLGCNSTTRMNPHTLLRPTTRTSRYVGRVAANPVLLSNFSQIPNPPAENITPPPAVASGTGRWLARNQARRSRTAELVKVCSVSSLVGWILMRVWKRVWCQKRVSRIVRNKTGHRVRINVPPMGMVGWGDSLSPGPPFPLMSPFENQWIVCLEFWETNTHFGP